MPGKVLDPRPLQLPRPPKAPLAPGTVTPSAWEIYLATSRVYLKEWTVFNDKMLGHFNDRQRDVKESMVEDWMGVVGDIDGPTHLNEDGDAHEDEDDEDDEEDEGETIEKAGKRRRGAKGQGRRRRQGFLKYMQSMEEDFRVRQHWDIAWEKHRDAMWTFSKTRDEAIRKLLRV